MKYVIYTDGSCLKNKRDSNCKGGYAFEIYEESTSGLVNIYSNGGSEINTTNNRMEMSAVIMGLTLLHEHLHEFKEHASEAECIVRTDSKYICDNYYDYLDIWRNNGWKRSRGGDVVNVDLWKGIGDLTPEFKSFKFEWVKGHSTNEMNNRVDIMSRTYSKGLIFNQPQEFQL